MTSTDIKRQSLWIFVGVHPPKFNSSPPEKGPFQEETSLPTTIFQGLY